MFLSLPRNLLEIGFALFDSYVVVNSFIAWRNHILSGRPGERCHKMYGIREARLKLIARWVKRCSRHYKRTGPHRPKRLRLVITNIYQNIHVILCELKATPVKVGSLYHNEPVKMPAGSSSCVVCKKKTEYCCWGCTSELGLTPVCPSHLRPNCNIELHNMRNEI